MPYLSLPAKLFQAGDYPDKGYRVDSGELDRLATATNGLRRVPLRFEHAPTDGVLDAGELVPGSVRRDGDWLVGTLRVAAGLLPHLRGRGLSVGINRDLGCFDEVSVTHAPRVAGAGFSGERESESDAATTGDRIVFTGGEIMPEETREETRPEGTDAAGGDEKPPNWFSRWLQSSPKPEPQPQADNDGTVTMSKDALAELVAAEVQRATEPLVQRVTDAESQVVNLSAKSLDERAELRRAEAVRGGVTPYVAGLLAPFAAGKAKATVQFSGEDKAREADFAAAAEAALTALEGSVPKGNQFARTDSRGETTSFDDATAKRAEVIFTERQAAGAPITRAQAQMIADSEVGGQEV